jgi:phosphocarrier protein HPr
MIEKQYNIIPATGLARPASMLVRISNNYLSKLALEYEGISVEVSNSPESIMDIMSLGIRPGAPIKIRAEGIDELQAIQSIEDDFKKMNLIKLI